jgi:hypothetical protein
MADNYYPQKNKKNKEESIRSEFLAKAHGDILQDMYAFQGVRAASDQAVHFGKSSRTHDMSKNSDRVKKRSTTGKTVIAASHVPHPISMLIDQRAGEWEITRSKAILRLIELGLEKLLLQANTSLLVAVMKEVLAQECRRFFGRITVVLFQIFIVLCQVLHLQKHTLSRSGKQKPLTAEDLDEIIAWSKTLAKADVLKSTNGGEALAQAIEQWLGNLKPTGEKGAAAAR